MIVYESADFFFLRPDPDKGGQPDMKAFQVSDQCTAMLRDGMLDLGNTDPKRMKTTESGKDLLYPCVLESEQKNPYIILIYS